jgi:hypothetical protein
VLASRRGSDKFSIVHFHQELKDEYYHKIGRKEDKALQTTQQSNLLVIKKTPLANRISGEKGLKLYCANCKRITTLPINAVTSAKHYAPFATALVTRPPIATTTRIAIVTTKRSTIQAIIINWEEIPIIALQRKGDTNNPAKLLKQSKKCLPSSLKKIKLP